MTDVFQSIAQSVIDEINKLVPSDTETEVVTHALPAVHSPSDPKPVLALNDGTWTLAALTAEILRNEGGFVDDPSDAGGVTNFGISVRFAKDHPEFFDFDHDHDVDRDDIRKITPQQAATAYIKYFFMPAHFDKLPNMANIMIQLFDMAVNMGVRYRDGETQAVKILQHALGIPADGELGPHTIDALDAQIERVGAAVMNNHIADARVVFYGQVVKAHPQDAKYLAGWTRRANKYRVA